MTRRIRSFSAARFPAAAVLLLAFLLALPCGFLFKPRLFFAMLINVETVRRITVRHAKAMVLSWSPRANVAFHQDFFAVVSRPMTSTYVVNLGIDLSKITRTIAAVNHLERLLELLLDLLLGFGPNANVSIPSNGVRLLVRARECTDSCTTAYVVCISKHRGNQRCALPW
jgi:hypothetical protein